MVGYYDTPLVYGRPMYHRVAELSSSLPLHHWDHPIQAEPQFDMVSPVIIQ